MRADSQFSLPDGSPADSTSHHSGGEQLRLRFFESGDTEQVIQLIDSVYREYGDRVCLENADRDLLEIDRVYSRAGGSFVVLANEQELVGCHAVLPLSNPPTLCTFRRLYLHSSRRGHGWGRILMQWAIDWAGAAGLEQVEFWSDTRFTRAHAFFQTIGFRRQEAVRQMDDGWARYQEYLFRGEIRSLCAAADRGAAAVAPAPNRQGSRSESGWV